MERRRVDAEEHRRSVLSELRSIHADAVVASGSDHTRELLVAGVALILQPRLDDVTQRRRTSVQALVRVGRTDEAFTYAPLVVKNHEVVEPAATRRLYEGSLGRLLPADADPREGVGLRSTPTVRRDGLLLGGALRMLESCNAADPGTRGAVIDRGRRLWWIDLGAKTSRRFGLKAYDALYEERLAVLVALDRWHEVGGAFPTSPRWHRECLTCEYAEHCAQELEAIDDVSLTRFTNAEQQRALREHGVTTRSQLAQLDPYRARSARAGAVTDDVAFAREDGLSRSIDKLDELIYRARAHVRGSALRVVASDQMGCPTADVEVDIDMESYDEATYLWGASVTVHRAVPGVEAGHVAFVEWGELTRRTEAVLFADFWSWLSAVRQQCHLHGRRFTAYCFWAQAEDRAMNRAVAEPLAPGPTVNDVEEFRSHIPVEWIDLHDEAKRQIQTEGPLGLKQLAGAAGFTWRDENPSGEASMQWYEVATGADEIAAQVSRQRILEYNEDDCRATGALREWLNGPARDLPHRDDLL